MSGRQSCLRPVVLASGSAARRDMLSQAGIAAVLQPPGLDEAPLKAELRAAGATADETALALARAKAEAALRQWPAGRAAPVVIAADQVLTCGGEWYDKPADLAAARRQLLALRGRTHRLTSAAIVWAGEDSPWQAVDSADLTMRRFGDAALDACLARDPQAALATVGGYRMEGPGLQLFERFEGDWFTILGMPLLPVIARLRHLGVVPE
ncbi:Maf family protein [Marinibaculum pumilum]|uniref:Nucleoside triphosphate pyrophosphatase n=1 Tax=Marinibaculum pumilum TaxID=1766165 RepID=A0ABV7KUM3_9PROT